jgi:hypothetical protein
MALAGASGYINSLAKAINVHLHFFFALVPGNLEFYNFITK